GREAGMAGGRARPGAQPSADRGAWGVPPAAAQETALAPLADRRRVAAEIARADRPRPAAPPPPAERRSRAGAFARDLAYAARLLVRAPGFLIVALLTLGLGLGTWPTRFRVVHATL